MRAEMRRQGGDEASAFLTEEVLGDLDGSRAIGWRSFGHPVSPGVCCGSPTP